MKLINVIFLVTLCTTLTFARVLPPKTEEKAISPDAGQETDKDNTESDGSGSGMEMFDSSGEGSASGDEEQNDEAVQLPRPMQFPFSNFKGPVTITPMEPGINNEKPVHRPCYMCFPRGRLGRVEVTAPGGPFLMNKFGLVGYGMGYGMGPPPMGPVGNPDMGFPEYGPFGPQGPCGPDGPCDDNDGDDDTSDSYEFQEMSEGNESPHPKPHHTSPKVMDKAPSKGAAVHPAGGKPIAAAAPKAPQNAAPLKGVADELVKKPVAELSVTLAGNGAQTAQSQLVQPAQQQGNVQQQPAQAQQAQADQTQQQQQVVQQQPAQQASPAQ